MGHNQRRTGTPIVNWAVFPCQPQGKAPWGKYAPHGHNSASSSPNIWADVPNNANWGINCAKSGLVVIDIDNGDIPDFCPPTYTVKTGRGWHLYYQAEPGDTYRGTLGEGIDVKHNGYVIAAGSRHPDGHLYELVDPQPPARLTPELRAILTNGERRTTHHLASSRPVESHRRNRVGLQKSGPNAPTGPAVRANTVMEGKHHPKVAGKTPSCLNLTVVLGSVPDVEDRSHATFVLIQADKRSKVHSGVTAPGRSALTRCNRFLPKYQVIAEYNDGDGYWETFFMDRRAWIVARHPDADLCSVCFPLIAI